MSLFRQFERVAKTNPQTIAIISGKNQLTYSNLLEMVELFEVNLLRRLPARDLRIAMTSNKLEFYLIMMLVASRNSYTVIFTDPETLRNCGVEYDYVVSEFEPENTRPGELIRIEPSWFHPQESTPNTAHRPVEGNAVFCAKTSGSTGQPMIYPVEEETFIDGLGFSVEYYVADPFATRIFCSVGAGLRWAHNNAFRALLRGGSVFTAPATEEHLPHLFNLHGVNVLAITPAFAIKLLSVDKAPQFLKGIQKIVLAGAFISPDLLKRMSEATPASITVAYGSTENNGLTASTYDPNITHPDGYLGEIVDPDFELAFFDVETRERIDGNEGILGIRHPRISRARPYLNQTGETRKGSFIDGFFIPGDIIRRDGNSLILLGRANNLVNIGGNKMSIELIEQSLAKIPDMGNIIAFSKPDENAVERLYVAYGAPEDVPLETLNETLSEDIKGAKIYQAKRFADFPVGITFKVDRKKVKEAFLA